jgi:CBS domain protein
MMRDEDVGLAPIVEGDRLVGTLTDRDIAIRVVAEGRDPESTLVKDVATSDVVTVDPGQDLDEALRLMAEHQVRRLPVVEDDGRVVGVVAQADVARQADDRKTVEVVERIPNSGGEARTPRAAGGSRSVNDPFGYEELRPDRALGEKAGQGNERRSGDCCTSDHRDLPSTSRLRDGPGPGNALVYERPDCAET